MSENSEAVLKKLQVRHTGVSSLDTLETSQAMLCFPFQVPLCCQSCRPAYHKLFGFLSLLVMSFPCERYEACSRISRSWSCRRTSFSRDSTSCKREHVTSVELRDDAPQKSIPVLLGVHFELTTESQGTNKQKAIWRECKTLYSLLVGPFPEARWFGWAGVCLFGSNYFSSLHC